MLEATTFEISLFGKLIITAQIAYWERASPPRGRSRTRSYLSAVYRVANALDDELQRSLFEENKEVATMISKGVSATFIVPTKRGFVCS